MRLSLLAGRVAAKLVARMATELEEVVRARIRQLRFERGLSLGALARASGLAVSTLSRLETGARRLTLGHIARVAVALDVKTDVLLGVDRAPVRVARDGKTWKAVGPERVDGARVYRVGIPVGGEEPVLHSHEGFQWLYVLSGAVRLVVERHDVVLSPGQATQFHTWRPHWLGAVGRPAEALIIFTPDGRPLEVVELGDEA
jgi:transcriptional regulator with XRE-family HTH domain